MKMKAPLATAVAIASGVIVLAAYFLRPASEGVLAILLGIATILAAVALWVGVLNLLSVHFKRIRETNSKSVYSLAVIVGFLLALLVGILDLQPQGSALVPDLGRPLLPLMINTIQIPVEGSLMALVAVTLVYAGTRFLSRRAPTLLSLTFLISALVFLVLNIGFLTSLEIDLVKVAAVAINRLPIAGARGILIGVALGSLTTGLRVLLGTDRPYGG